MKNQHLKSIRCGIQNHSEHCESESKVVRTKRALTQTKSFSKLFKQLSNDLQKTRPHI